MNDLRCFDCGNPATHVCTLLIGAPDVKRLVCDKGLGSFADSDFWSIRKLTDADRKATA